MKKFPIILVKNFMLKSFVILILSISNACAMNKNMDLVYDSKTQTTKIIKPLNPPVSVPFDLTKKGNKTEFLVKIKETDGFVFELQFHYDDPRRSKYEWVENLKSFFPERPDTAEELKDYYRVSKLVGGRLPENPNDVYGKWIEYPGISTPIRLVITKLEKNGAEKIIFDDVKEPEEARAGSYFHKRIGTRLLHSGVYKIKIEALKDSQEFIGSKIYLFMQVARGGK